jgi:hypothetical protein
MKKTTALAVAGSALAVTFSLTFANSPSGARPNSVAANAWIAITPDAGFVVTGRGETQPASLGGAPSVKGYLMVRREDKWLRLEPEATGRLVPIN